MIKKILLLVILASTMLFAELPYNKIFRGVPNDVASYLYEQNAGTDRFQTIPLTTVAEDTVITSYILKQASFIESICISVIDTVESQGDTCYFKLFIGGTKVLDQKTSAFKLPGGYVFTPLADYINSTNSYIYKAVANTTSGQTTGITEGNFKVTVKYFIP
jgi:hypothetical protein